SPAEIKEKILQYRSYGAGFYFLEDCNPGRTAVARTHALWRAEPSTDSLYLHLRPGDTLFPNCFAVLVRRRNAATQKCIPANFFAAETDICYADGSIRKQRPLFRECCHLRPFSEDSLEYVNHGYRHQVLTFAASSPKTLDKGATLVNHLPRWNNCALRGMTSDMLYISDSLACLKAWEPVDELDDLLFSFEQILSACRVALEQPDIYVIGQGFEAACRAQLVKYALWRSFVLHVQGRKQEAEDCFLFAPVIFSTIVHAACWRSMECLLTDNDPTAKAWLDAYFEQEDEPVRPERPLEGGFSRIRQGLRRLCLREKKSRFSDW
ncbi:hypothetical protein LJC09_04805, partial [Desulfovibrio sp. OttesenSCG-928-F20]|nr:hypothetical protein [Desulfovibrio sp. OttesenSCG-928-F20]